MTPVADDDVTVRPDLRRLRVKTSDSDSSPECTGELERDAVVAPLPRRALRLPARTKHIVDEVLFFKNRSQYNERKREFQSHNKFTNFGKGRYSLRCFVSEVEMI